MKPTTIIALLVAWIWVFQGCDTKKDLQCYKKSDMKNACRKAILPMHDRHDMKVSEQYSRESVVF